MQIFFPPGSMAMGRSRVNLFALSPIILVVEAYRAADFQYRQNTFFLDLRIENYYISILNHSCSRFRKQRLCVSRNISKIYTLSTVYQRNSIQRPPRLLSFDVFSTQTTQEVIDLFKSINCTT